MLRVERRNVSRAWRYCQGKSPHDGTRARVLYAATVTVRQTRGAAPCHATGPAPLFTPASTAALESARLVDTLSRPAVGAPAHSRSTPEHARHARDGRSHGDPS